MDDELHQLCSEVVGEIPAELAGSFLRIGSNPVFVADASAYHPFDGDGMIHEVLFSNGTATYFNRFVDTKGQALEREKGDWIWARLAAGSL